MIAQHSPRDIVKFILYFLVAVVILCIFSCTTTKKNKTSHTETTKTESKSKIDSTTAAKIDSMKTARLDSIRVKRSQRIRTVNKKDKYVKETVVEFTPADKDTGASTSSSPAEDYFYVGDMKIKGKVSKITTKESGTKTEKQKTVSSESDSSRVANFDSSHVAASNTADLHKTDEAASDHTETDKGKTVNRTSYTGLILMVILTVITLGLCWYNWGPIKAFLIARKILKSKSEKTV